jgi:Xaa-Pro aminopeptidase
MRLFCLWTALAVAHAAASAGPAPEEFRSRRQALAKAQPDGVTVLFARGEEDHGDLRSGFFQESNFYYLTGWMEPGAALLIEPEGAGKWREILFLPKRNPEREKWTGQKTDPLDERAPTLTGFDHVKPVENLESELKKSLERLSKIYTVSERATASLKALAPLREVGSAELAIARLRMRKSPREIEMIERATQATMEAHRAAWKRAAPGLYEYQVAAAMLAVYMDQGCERSSYAPIVGSGPNSTILHYSRNSRRVDSGDVLLMDVGAECAGYAADLTRTIPIGGRFTARQREIYDIVLGAQKAAIAAIKPGVRIGKTAPDSIYKVAYDYINTHGKDLHGNPLGRYFTHGVGHHVGLDVHDAWDPDMPLEENMIITVEPGIYIPEEKIGIRIEDMVLVTRDGARVLSADLPREIAEIEKAIGR